MDSLKQLRVTQKSQAYWRITFDNPPINLVDTDSFAEFARLMDMMEAAPNLKVVVFDSANPDFFIAHFQARLGARNPSAPKPGGHYPWTDFITRLSKLPAVSVAAIRGRARGVGSEFALACDIRFASLERAIFAQIEVGAGLIPGGGGLERLPRLMGRSRALEVVLGCDDLDAAVAERYGWVNRAIPDHEFEAFVERFARRVASFDQQALGAAKRLVDLHHKGPTPAEFDETQAIFVEALTWPGAAARIPKLIEMGLGRPSDLELNFGRSLDDLAE
ncbi:MAG TPA: enoyl-CoA hydratase/isomerase family protein [Casimicrobiaceae bacterium]|nr:enoyl-CoA hydratase/isomerase family protein [Casimicrobiaceae bacterium]